MRKVLAFIIIFPAVWVSSMLDMKTTVAFLRSFVEEIDKKVNRD